MILALRNLARNLVAGFRLALFVPVSRLAFRIDLPQLLLVVVASAAIDVFTEWVQAGPEARLSWFGAGSEIFGAGMLILVSAAMALLLRERELALAVPVITLAAFPAIQFVRTTPDVFPALAEAAPAWAAGAFEVALAAWMLAVFVRVVAVALGAGHPHRAARAAAGGLMLGAGVALSPLVAPNDGWWLAGSAGADGRYPNPASEPVQAAQATLLDDALADLDDATPGETDLYFVGFAGDARDDAYREDVTAAQRAMDEHRDTGDRSLALVNSPATLLDTPMATVTHLRETLKEIAAAIDPDEDVVMLYLTGPSDADGTLAVALPPLELVPVTPAVLRALLDEAGIVWRVVVVSACRADAFVDVLASETTAVLAASGNEAAGACAVGGEATKLGSALFRDAIPRAGSLQQALEAAKAAVGAPAARLSVGTEIAKKLEELDRRRATRGAGRTV